MSNVTVGHSDTLTIQQLDQNGNPMLTEVPYDSAPVWVNTPSDPNVDTFAAAADGTSAILNALAAGSDTVGVTATVGGASFSASVLVNIQAVEQKLSSISIVENVA